MTTTDHEASRLFVAAEEEDREQPFDQQLRELPEDDDILAALALQARYEARARELRLDLEAQLQEERRKAGVL